MALGDGSRNGLPVWRCSETDVCGEQWASARAADTCPFCHLGIGQSTGFTCDDVAEAATKYGFSDFPVHMPQPLPELVQLSSLPSDLWIGLPVLHPSGQVGKTANWLLYDVGIVTALESDPDLAGEFRCRFITSSESSLIYSPGNLWVPKILAQRLQNAASRTEAAAQAASD